MLFRWQLFAAVALIAAIAAAIVLPSLSAGQSARADGHTLEGQAWSAKLNALVSEAEILAALKSAPFVALGEIHDNAGHHRRRAQWIAAALAGRPIVFEQLRADQQPALDSFAELTARSPDKATVAELKRVLDWDKSGWMKDGYDPLFQAAIDAKLPITAGDVTRAAIMNVAKGGEGALPDSERARLRLDVPLGAKLDDASLSEIEEAHCGAMPKEAFGGMAYAQRYRDASLADAVLKAADKYGAAVLIAGNGHVRTDRGVPWYIHSRAPDKTVISVMFVEVEDRQNDPQTYVPRDPDGKPAADYIFFTARSERGDPCENMREKMKK